MGWGILFFLLTTFSPSVSWASPDDPQGLVVPTSPRSLEVRARQLGTPAAPGPLALSVAQQGLRVGKPVFLRIFKQKSPPRPDLIPSESGSLELWIKNESGSFSLFKTYPVAKYSGLLGPKTRQGDAQAPEGFYAITPGLMNPDSSNYLGLNLGYPNAFEQQRGWTGSALLIHGGVNSVGCYAMTNPGIEEIYVLVEAALLAGKTSVPVQIFPFPLTPENLRASLGISWLGFWANLAEGYSLFERDKIPPGVGAVNGNYVFREENGG